MPKIMYICDPDLNVDCMKMHCHRNDGACTLTSKIKYAKKPVEKAILIFDVNEEDLPALANFQGDDKV